MLIVFCALGLLYSFWLLGTGINVLLSLELFAIVFPFMPQVMVCIVPAVLLLFILHLTESKYANNKWVIRLLIALTAFDLLLLFTNPFHKEFFTGFDGRTPLVGRIMPLHLTISYTPIVITIIVLYTHIAKSIRKKPFLGLVGLGTLCPLVLNVLYSFGIFDIGFDLTPFAFITMYGALTVYSLKMRLFDIKEAASSEIFFSLSDALIVVDRQGLITNVNPAFQKAFPDVKISLDTTPIRTVAEYIRSIALDFDPPDVLDRLFSNTPENVGGVEITVSADEVRNYTLSRDIIFDKGYYVGYIVTLSDVSNYRNMIDMVTELKTEADTASSAKGIFLSHMSHEIRTPLNAIVGMINIGISTDDVDKKNYCLVRADSASKHLLGIINEVLDMSKIEAEKFELSYSVMNIEKMLMSITNVANVRAEEKRQNFSVNVGADVPAYIECDELRLSQVITNLVTNAIKFTPEEGTVSLNLSKIKEYGGSVILRFEVIDSGIGISAEQQQKLFSSYSQADAGISTKFGGTGLGLVISKRIVELMGGEITIVSEIGKGATFMFTINAAIHSGEPDEEPESAKYELQTPHYDFYQHTLLIAEDVEINREILSAVLAETNVSIDFAENGKAAVSMFSEHPGKYSLILMDVSMPEMNGYDATRAIRALDIECAGKVPIIAMTAHVFKEDIEKCLESGMNDHTGKPVDAYALIGMLNKYLTRPAEAYKLRDVHKLDVGVAWDDSLITGNALVDMQHQRIFEKVSTLVRSCEDGADIAKLGDTLMFLLNHTTRHFADEEALQTECGYPDYRNHKKMHDDFKVTVKELLQRFEASGSSVDLSHDVNKTIVQWLVTHIQHEDKKISEHIKRIAAVKA